MMLVHLWIWRYICFHKCAAPIDAFLATVPETLTQRSPALHGAISDVFTTAAGVLNTLLLNEGWYIKPSNHSSGKVCALSSLYVMRAIYLYTFFLDVKKGSLSSVFRKEIRLYDVLLRERGYKGRRSREVNREEGGKEGWRLRYAGRGVWFVLRWGGVCKLGRLVGRLDGREGEGGYAIKGESEWKV